MKGRERLPHASPGPEGWAWVLYGNRRDFGLPRFTRNHLTDRKAEPSDVPHPGFGAAGSGMGAGTRNGGWGDFLATDGAGNIPTGQAIRSGVQGLLRPRAHCKWSGRVWALVTNC